MKDELALAKQLGMDLPELRRVAAQGKIFYVYKKLQKQRKTRVLRVPRSDLLQIQRAIKTHLLDRMPLPASMHGWRMRHSPKTYVSSHVRQVVVLNIDIQDFFPSVGGGRVCAFWERAGYSHSAARLLTALTVCDNQLPQGSPTSQGIGNQVLQRLNLRLSCLAHGHGLRYSNYADEITISGPNRAVRLKDLVLRIIRQEGFSVNPQKIKIRQRHDRQELAGIVVNKKPSLGRDKYRTLRGIIHNCVKLGPYSQNAGGHPNFKQHLRGRIAQFQHVSPRLGEQLVRDFEEIQWAQGQETK